MFRLLVVASGMGSYASASAMGTAIKTWVATYEFNFYAVLRCCSLLCCAMLCHKANTNIHLLSQGDGHRRQGPAGGHISISMYRIAYLSCTPA